MIYILDEQFQEFDDPFINKILSSSKSQFNKTQINYINNDSEKTELTKFINIVKLWIKNNYDTNILLYKVSFPLLRKLVEVGDSKAKKVFINEILKNLMVGDPLVIKYLVNEKYDEYVEYYNYRKQIHTPKIKDIKLTLFICVINILIFIIFSESFHVGNLLFFNLQKIINDFEVWRIFTAIFMHSERFTLFINTLFLFCVGSYFEANNILSKSVYLIVYIVSGVMGNLIYILISSELPAYLVSAGASGAIFGLVGAFLIILLVKRNYNWLIIYIVIGSFFYIYTIDPKINYVSHLFGFITGIISYLLCILMYQQINKNTRPKKDLKPNQKILFI